MSEILGPPPEETAVKGSERANITFADEITEQFPPQDKTSSSRSNVNHTDSYWGIVTALAVAKLGLPIGFEMDTNAPSEDAVVLYGSDITINYWLNLAGFEHRGWRNNLADSESRSGLFTMMVEPSSGELFEHMYALRTGTPVTEVIQRDPMFTGLRDRQPATQYEVIDHDGVENMYRENPEQCIGIYLARMLPRLKHLRSTIGHTKSALARFELGQTLDDTNPDELIASNRARLERWQIQYDFTMGLVMEGFKPYTLAEMAPLADAYIVGLLSVRQELHPSDITGEIPDVRDEIRNMLTGIERRNEAGNN